MEDNMLAAFIFVLKCMGVSGIAIAFISFLNDSGGDSDAAAALGEWIGIVLFLLGCVGLGALDLLGVPVR
jgi:hypothetical protein